MDQSHARFFEIMSHLVAKPIHPSLRPIVLSEDMLTCFGVGTLILSFTGQPSGIITAAHLFPRGKNLSQLFYRECQDEIFFPINRITEPVKEDVALCLLGPTAPIRGFSKHRGGFWDSSKSGQFYKCAYPDCTQLTTGRKFPVLGHVIDTDGECYYMLDYQSCPGESGSGFLRDGNDLYVMRGRLMVTDSLKEVLGLPQSQEIIELASCIRFN